MSHERDKGQGPQLCFPRVSGDEPDTRMITMAQLTFSPRERG